MVALVLVEVDPGKTGRVIVSAKVMVSCRVWAANVVNPCSFSPLLVKHQLWWRLGSPHGVGVESRLGPVPAAQWCVLGPCLARLYCNGSGEDPNAAHTGRQIVGKVFYLQVRQKTGRICCRGRKAGTATEQAGRGQAGSIMGISPENAGETSTGDIEQSDKE